MSSLKPGEGTRVSVRTDHTWEYRWDTSSTGLDTGLDTGSYTTYAVNSMSDKSHLAGTQYATIPILLKQPGMITGSSTTAVAKGNAVHI